MVASALPLTAALLERQSQEGFNAVLLNDVTGWDRATQQWSRQTAESIVTQLGLARAHDFSVFVCVAAILPPPPGDPRRIRAARGVPIADAPDSTVHFGLQSENAHDPSSWSLVDPATVQTRLKLWTGASGGELIGVFFSPDDSFLLRIPSATQRLWFALSREVDPSLPVLGIVGELGLSGTSAEMQPYWDASAFDAVIWLNYPYNLGRFWRRSLNHQRSSDPDGDLVRYERDYARAMQSRYFRDLSRRQWIIPVIQTFHYRGDSPGAVPRVRDIELQAQLMRRAVQSTLGQPGNLILGYFFTGSAETDAEVLGMYDFPEWSAAAATENHRLEYLEVAERRIKPASN
ncbi:MAG: hypothetical protein ABIP63_02710 [Thermoanaerobaculia bacterium]